MSVESGSGGAAYGDGVAAELARLREALDDLRRRPIPLDVGTLRHVVTASLAEASAPPPNLLVTAIRRLDRLDARLETIEGLLGGPAALPRGGPPPGSGAERGRPATLAAPALSSMPAQYAAPPDPEAVAEALARRLAGVLAAQAPAVPGARGATVDDLIAALRPLIPGAARAVLRRAGREPSPQAVEVLQQTALHAIQEAAGSLGPYAAPASAFAAPPEAPRLPSPPALAPAPPPAPAAAPGEPLDLDALAATIAARVADAVVAAIPAQAPPPVDEAVRVRPERQEPPPRPIDPALVADAVISRLAQQPPPQAVVSPMAMAPLLSAVGNVEAAVAQLAEPEAGVVVAVDRLEAGVEALARALEEDRSAQADEVRRGFAEVTSLVRTELAAQPRSADPGVAPAWADRAAAGATAEGGDGGDEGSTDAAPGASADATALAGIHRRLDRLTEKLAPLAESDLATAVPELTTQNQRLERSLGNILTALAALAEHLDEETATWQRGFDSLGTALAAGAVAPAPADLAPLQRDLRDLADRVDDLVAGTVADRQRFQRLGGTIDGLAQLIGQVSERLDRLPRGAPADGRRAPVPTAGGGPAPTPGEEPHLAEATEATVAPPPPHLTDDGGDIHIGDAGATKRIGEVDEVGAPPDDDVDTGGATDDRRDGDTAGLLTTDEDVEAGEASETTDDTGEGDAVDLIGTEESIEAEKEGETADLIGTDDTGTDGSSGTLADTGTDQDDGARPSGHGENAETSEDGHPGEADEPALDIGASGPGQAAEVVPAEPPPAAGPGDEEGGGSELDELGFQHDDGGPAPQAEGSAADRRGGSEPIAPVQDQGPARPASPAQEAWPGDEPSRIDLDGLATDGEVETGAEGVERDDHGETGDQAIDPAAQANGSAAEEVSGRRRRGRRSKRGRRRG